MRTKLIYEVRSSPSKRRLRYEDSFSGDFSSQSSIMSQGYSFTQDDTSPSWENITWSASAPFSSTSDLITQNSTSETSTRKTPLSPINKAVALPTCSCVSSVLSTLKRLHGLVEYVGTAETFTTRSLDVVLCTTRGALSTCESFQDCKSCHNPLTSILCATVLQKLFLCYKILGSSHKNNETGLSINIGGVEFADVSLYPRIIRGILEGEKKRAAAVCEALIGSYGASKGELLHKSITSQQEGDDGLQAFLQILSDRFLGLDISTH